VDIDGRYLYASDWMVQDRTFISFFRIDEVYIHAGIAQEVKLVVDREGMNNADPIAGLIEVLDSLGIDNRRKAHMILYDI